MALAVYTPFLAANMSGYEQLGVKKTEEDLLTPVPENVVMYVPWIQLPIPTFKSDSYESKLVQLVIDANAALRRATSELPREASWTCA